MARTVNLVQPGALKPNNNPYTICIIANPYIESPKGSGHLLPDPISHSEQLFNTKVHYILSSLFGRLPNQAETMLAPLANDFRVISIFDDGLAPADDNTLVTESRDLIEPRQVKFGPFMKKFSVSSLAEIWADVVFAITSSNVTRSSAFWTWDNDGGPGVPLTLDGIQYYHRYFNLHPGVIALHSTAHSLVALHEFGHAASSWTNGQVVDLYFPQPAPQLNVKIGAPPIPAQFGRYNNFLYTADPTRGGIGYPAAPPWPSYGAQLTNAHAPAVMDNFWFANPPEQCMHDGITRRFLIDRIMAIMSRP